MPKPGPRTHRRRASVHFTSWDQALDALLTLGSDRPIPVVLDEFPYLAREAKELPSVIQKALSPARRQRAASRTRLLLCGSSISFMGGLLSGGAPLRGRAALELIVPTFDFRQAAEFWAVSDYRLAALMYFVVGGTPAYRTEHLRGETAIELQQRASGRRSGHGRMQDFRQLAMNRRDPAVDRPVNG